MGPEAMIFTFECRVFIQLSPSPLSLSSNALQFLLAFCHKDGVICISEVIGMSLGNLDSSLLHRNKQV